MSKKTVRLNNQTIILQNLNSYNIQQLLGKFDFCAYLLILFVIPEKRDVSISGSSDFTSVFD